MHLGGDIRKYRCNLLIETKNSVACRRRLAEFVKEHKLDNFLRHLHVLAFSVKKKKSGIEKTENHVVLFSHSGEVPALYHIVF